MIDMVDLFLGNDGGDDVAGEVYAALVGDDRQEAALIATDLLERFGFDGSTRDTLQRIADGRSDDPDDLDWVIDLRDARQREAALADRKVGAA